MKNIDVKEEDIGKKVILPAGTRYVSRITAEGTSYSHTTSEVAALVVAPADADVEGDLPTFQFGGEFRLVDLG